jgi:hypothetical protein
VLGCWEHPEGPAKAYGLRLWYRLRVHGPLPGRPREAGEFVLLAWAYGTRPGWWIAPEM